MTIQIGGTYWMERVDSSMRKQLSKRHGSIRKTDAPELVTVDALTSGTDKVGDYLRVRFTYFGRGTTNEVKTYLTGTPALNFIFTPALG